MKSEVVVFFLNWDRVDNGHLLCYVMLCYVVICHVVICNVQYSLLVHSLMSF